MTSSLHLVRFGELGLKSRQVRNRFLQTLSNNIRRHLHERGDEAAKVRKYRSRLLVEASSDPGDVLRRSFGVVSFSPVAPVMTSMEAFCSRAVEIYRAAGGLPSFAVRVKRLTKDTPYNSQDLAREAGAAVREEFPEAEVNLRVPQLKIEFELDTRNGSHSFSQRIPGPGGLPIGTAGRAVARLQDERDLVAAWLMLRRGTSLTILDGNNGLVEDLRNWWPFVRVSMSDDDNHAGTPVVVGWDASRTISEGHSETLVLNPMVGLSQQEVADLLANLRS